MDFRLSGMLLPLVLLLLTQGSTSLASMGLSSLLDSAFLRTLVWVFRQQGLDLSASRMETAQHSTTHKPWESHAVCREGQG